MVLAQRAMWTPYIGPEGFGGGVITGGEVDE